MLWWGTEGKVSERVVASLGDRGQFVRVGYSYDAKSDVFKVTFYIYSIFITEGNIVTWLCYEMVLFS